MMGETPSDKPIASLCVFPMGLFAMSLVRSNINATTDTNSAGPSQVPSFENVPSNCFALALVALGGPAHDAKQIIIIYRFTSLVYFVLYFIHLC